MRTATSHLSLILSASLGLGACAGELEELEEPLAEDADALSVGLSSTIVSPGHPGFNPASPWHGFFCIGSETCAAGQMNADSRADLVTFVPAAGGVYIATTNTAGTGPASTSFFPSPLVTTGRDFMLGDVDNDNLDDLIAFVKSTGAVQVALRTPSGFATPTIARSSGFCRGAEVCRVGDVNDDGRTDLVRFVRNATPGFEGDVWVSLAPTSGTTFTTPLRWHDTFCFNSESCDVGDFTGEGKADIVTFVHAAAPHGGAWVARSNGIDQFVETTRVSTELCVAGQTCTVGNVDGLIGPRGSRKDDLIAFNREVGGAVGSFDDSRGDVYVQMAVLDLSTSSNLDFGEPHIRAADFCRASETCIAADLNGDTREDLIAFTKSTVAGAAEGDVRVALSNFGKPKNWKQDLVRIRATVTEGSGDKPLIMALHFRAKFGRHGTPTIVRNVYNETFATGIVAGGPTITIPANVGEFTFTNVTLPTVDQLMGFVQPEIMGTVVIVFEKDLSAADSYNGLMDEATRALNDVLVADVENRTSLVLTSPAQLQAVIDDVQARLQTHVHSAIDDLVWWVVSGIFDPDDYINAHVYLYPAVDYEVADFFSLDSTNPMVSVHLPGWGAGGSFFHNQAYQDDSPLLYRIENIMFNVP